VCSWFRRLRFRSHDNIDSPIIYSWPPGDDLLQESFLSQSSKQFHGRSVRVPHFTMHSDTNVRHRYEVSGTRQEISLVTTSESLCIQRCRTCLQDSTWSSITFFRFFSRKLETLFYFDCRNSLILDEHPMFRDFSEDQGLETSCALVHNAEFELESRSINVYIWSQRSLDHLIAC